MIGHIARFSISAAALIGLAANAEAVTPFDGEWSVLIITEIGTCDQSYRFAGRITNGIIVYEGGGAITASGRVAPSGAVTVTVTIGENRGVGFGRIVGNSGTGTWRGQNSRGGGLCSGAWKAERKTPQS
jgi:hypothetical protein